MIPAFDYEQAKRLAEKVSEFCSCDVETFVGITDTPPTRVLSETVFQRECFHAAHEPADE